MDETPEPTPGAAEAGELAARLAQQEQDLAAARAVAGAAVARARELLLASDPAVPAELVAGTTIEEVEESFAKARQIVGRVRAEVEVGAGAPGRSVAEPATPFEKIRAGLAALE